MNSSDFANPEHNRLLPCEKPAYNQCGNCQLRQELDSIIFAIQQRARARYHPARQELHEICEMLSDALNGGNHVSNEGVGNTV